MRNLQLLAEGGIRTQVPYRGLRLTAAFGIAVMAVYLPGFLGEVIKVIVDEDQKDVVRFEGQALGAQQLNLGEGVVAVDAEIQDLGPGIRVEILEATRDEVIGVAQSDPGHDAVAEQDDTTAGGWLVLCALDVALTMRVRARHTGDRVRVFVAVIGFEFVTKERVGRTSVGCVLAVEQDGTHGGGEIRSAHD